MSVLHFIAGDWGTTNLRVYLCGVDDDGRPKLLEALRGPGVAELSSAGDASAFEHALFERIDPWLGKVGDVPIMLSGMVGSTIGWREAPYQSCPVQTADIARRTLSFESRGREIHLIPGLSTVNPFGSPDVMRGEELQLLGLAALVPPSADQTRLVCLPGTHNKWVRCLGDQVETFTTALTGELFAVLGEHSILLRGADRGQLVVSAFKEGLELARKLDGGQLLHALFSTRSRQVMGELGASDAESYLSGLLVGADVQGALKLFGRPRDKTAVHVIGDGVIGTSYRLALEGEGCAVSSHEPDEIALAAYGAVCRAITTPGQ
ncbi:MAG: 2-dehydro-3-deoxygalactonokinase [Pseudomonadota bacterium]